MYFPYGIRPDLIVQKTKGYSTYTIPDGYKGIVHPRAHHNDPFKINGSNRCEYYVSITGAAPFTAASFSVTIPTGVRGIIAIHATAQAATTFYIRLNGQNVDLVSTGDPLDAFCYTVSGGDVIDTSANNVNTRKLVVTGLKFFDNAGTASDGGELLYVSAGDQLLGGSATIWLYSIAQ